MEIYFHIIKLIKMKNLFTLFLILISFSAIAQKPKTPTKKQPEKPSIPIVNCFDLVDNPEKYIGKTIIVSLGYLSTPNGGMGLRKSENNNYEVGLSLNLEFYNENDKYNTRVVDCNGSSNLFIRIPKDEHSTFPNSQSGYFYFLGVMKDRKTFIAYGARRP